jgi:hypothetical protein
MSSLYFAIMVHIDPASDFEFEPAVFAPTTTTPKIPVSVDAGVTSAPATTTNTPNVPVFVDIDAGVISATTAPKIPVFVDADIGTAPATTTPKVPVFVDIDAGVISATTAPKIPVFVDTDIGTAPATTTHEAQRAFMHLLLFIHTLEDDVRGELMDIEDAFMNDLEDREGGLVDPEEWTPQNQASLQAFQEGYASIEDFIFDSIDGADEIIAVHSSLFEIEIETEIRSQQPFEIDEIISMHAAGFSSVASINPLLPLVDFCFEFFTETKAAVQYLRKDMVYDPLKHPQVQLQEEFLCATTAFLDKSLLELIEEMRWQHSCEIGGHSISRLPAMPDSSVLPRLPLNASLKRTRSPSVDVGNDNDNEVPASKKIACEHQIKSPSTTSRPVN